MTEVKRHRSDTKMVPVPSHSIVPERDVNEIPVLETRHLGIEFGGLKAVDDFNLTIGKTEIAGLIRAGFPAGHCPYLPEHPPV